MANHEQFMVVKVNRNFIWLKIGVCLLLAAMQAKAQVADSILSSMDTLRATVSAYETNRPADKIPAAISVVSKADLDNYTGSSMVNALNAKPGVRMEERSPGSYRLNFRGSSLRSPFGVRNVKIYLNDIPLTDAGGNTYLNQFDYHAFSSIEIVKGPASSLYGAGSGGAMLIHTASTVDKYALQADLFGGCYGLAGIHAAAGFGKEKFSSTIDVSHQQSDGWRNHTAMRRNIVLYENMAQVSNRQSLQTMFMYGDLFYETPGALTLSQYEQNPKAARTAGGPFPSAETAKAAIYQKTVLAGITNKYAIAKNWDNTTAVYAAASWFKNPTFRLYEKRTEPHTGGRTVFTNDFNLGHSLLHVVYGAEVQKGIFSSQTFKNNNGQPDSISTDDEIDNFRYSVFTQASYITHGWNITAGLSYNKSNVGIDRLLVYPVVSQKRKFNSELASRVAIMKSFKNINVYGSVSKGFSPPTTAELLPGTGEINTTLKAEHGISYEAGIKSTFFKQRLQLDLTLYHFNLYDAIALRRDAGGGDYYVNAGKTKQDGIELFAGYALIDPARAKGSLSISAAYTGNFYAYKDFAVLDESYDGKQLPGIPKNNIVIMLNGALNNGLYAFASYQNTSKIALNDANAVYADPYHILGARIGWKLKQHQKQVLDVFIAGDNLLNETYSLGNDINAAANRYYNAAPKINFSAGASFRIGKQ